MLWKCKHFSGKCLFLKAKQLGQLLSLGQQHAVLTGDGLEYDGTDAVHRYAHTHGDAAQQDPAAVCAQHHRQSLIGSIGGSAHNQGRQQGPQQIADDGGMLRDALLHTQVVQQADGKIGNDGTQRGTQNPDIGIAHQPVDDGQLHHAADQHIDYRHISIAMGLHEGVGELNGGVQENGDAQGGHELGSQHQPLTAVIAKQGHNGPGQYRQTHSAGKADEARDPAGGLLAFLHGGVVAQGQT